MKIILLKDIPKIGRKYDVKDVADGYALNLLIPRELAAIASPQAMKRVEQMKEKEGAEKKIQADLLLKNLETIKGLTLNLKEKANDKGHLFAGVTKEILVIVFDKFSANLIKNDSIINAFKYILRFLIFKFFK